MPQHVEPCQRPATSLSVLPRRLPNSTMTCCRNTRASCYEYDCEPCFLNVATNFSRAADTVCAGTFHRHDCPQESRHQNLLDRLAFKGTWVRSDDSPTSADGWQWELPKDPGVPSNYEVSTTSSIHALRGQWILVVGDSRARFLYASLISLLGGAPQGTLLPTGWPNHRIPLHSPKCRANTIHDAYVRCKSLVRGECVGDDMTSASDRAGVRPGCILDFVWRDARGATKGHGHRHGAREQGVRLTFLWYASEAMSEQASDVIVTDCHFPLIAPDGQ